MRLVQVLVTRNKRKLPIEKFLSTVGFESSNSLSTNQDVAVQLRRWTRELVTVPCEDLNPTMTHFFVIFVCSVFLAVGLATLK